MKKTFVKTSTKVVPESKKRVFPVWVVIRHTRAGDERIGVYDAINEKSRDRAMQKADDVCSEAARIYGHGSASVFKGRLTLNKDCEVES